MAPRYRPRSPRVQRGARPANEAADPASSGPRPEIPAMDELRAYEHELRRAGLPLLIEDYTAGGDIFNRAFPLLALVFLGEMLGR